MGLTGDADPSPRRASTFVVLRALLRRDPDIIMVGEIRDGDTAEIAIKAAINGPSGTFNATYELHQ